MRAHRGRPRPPRISTTTAGRCSRATRGRSMRRARRRAVGRAHVRGRHVVGDRDRTCREVRVARGALDPRQLLDPRATAPVSMNSNGSPRRRRAARRCARLALRAGHAHVIQVEQRRATVRNARPTTMIARATTSVIRSRRRPASRITSIRRSRIRGSIGTGHLPTSAGSRCSAARARGARRTLPRPRRCTSATSA